MRPGLLYPFIVYLVDCNELYRDFSNGQSAVQRYIALHSALSLLWYYRLLWPYQEYYNGLWEKSEFADVG